MTLIECPKCKREADIDAPSVTKEEDGLDLIVTCPRCNTPFIIQQVASVRQRLLTAQYGVIKDKRGRRQRVQIRKTDD